MSNSPQSVQEILHHADLIYAETQVQSALHQLAEDINAKLANEYPLILSVMGGAVVFTGQLLPLLKFPLDFDYVHVSRYGDAQQGGEMHWTVEPRENVRGRTVLVLDDILDEGHTMSALHERVLELGARQFYSAVFVDKKHDKIKPIQADFVGLEVPDRFVFGYGMDIKGAWRNLPAIYAAKEQN